MTDPQALAAEALALCAAATPGPWSEDDGNVFSTPLSREREDVIMRIIAGEALVHPDDGLREPIGWVASTGQDQPNFESDAAFIARMRTLGPELADAVLALTAERDALREALAMRDECAHCSALLFPPDVLPHCEDCNVTDEDEERWEARRAIAGKDSR